MDVNSLMGAKKILLLSHYGSYAMQDLLFEYLIKQKIFLVKKVNFPLPELPFLKHLEITTARNGRIVKLSKVKSLYSPPIVAYFFHCLQLLFISLLSKEKYDFVIAQDSLLASVSIVLRWLGKCKKIIFYSHGLDNSRFRHRLLLILYKSLDKFAARRSDYNWLLSKKMIEIRKNQGITPQKIYWVPASIPIDSIRRKTTALSKKIIFIGVLDERNGVMILPNIIKEVKKKLSTVTLDIIGDGVFNKRLQRKAESLGLQKNMNFLGKLNFKEYADLLTDYSLGLAPYAPSCNNLTSLTDPMKIRIYLAAGLPVVVTKGFNFSKEIENHHLGFSVDHKVKSFADVVIKLLENNSLNKTIRAKALAYSKKYDLHQIYDKIFKKIL